MASQASALISEFAALPDARARLDEALEAATVTELAALEHDWAFWSRPEQRLPEGAWTFALARPGRGWGKTRMGAEETTARILDGRAMTVGIVNRSEGDCIGINVNHRTSGLLAVAPPWFKPRQFAESTSRGPAHLLYPNGARANILSAEVADCFRGYEYDFIWWDEFAFAPRENKAALWYNLRMALRGCEGAQALLTSTPKRGCAILRGVLETAKKRPHAVHMIRGHTFDNAENQPKTWLEDMAAEYEGTKLGKVELEGGDPDEDDGPIFKQSQINADRVETAPALVRVAVGYDPAVSSKRGADETGIVAGGEGARGGVFILEDASGNHSPDTRPRKAIELYLRHRAPGRPCADVLVAETNKGGDMIAKSLRDAWDRMKLEGLIPDAAALVILEVFTFESKPERADPVAAMYERHEVHHVGHKLTDLEDEMVGWDPHKDAKSPNRVDACVYVCAELGGKARREDADAIAAVNDAMPTRGDGAGAVKDTRRDAFEPFEGGGGGGDWSFG